MAADDKHAEKAREFAALVLEGLPRFEAAGPSDCDDAKTIYFVRHGEATHNVAPRPWAPSSLMHPSHRRWAGAGRDPSGDHAASGAGYRGGNRVATHQSHPDRSDRPVRSPSGRLPFIAMEARGGW